MGFSGRFGADEDIARERVEKGVEGGCWETEGWSLG